MKYYIYYGFLLWLSIQSVTSFIQTCDYHVKESLHGAGMGLFASRDVEPFEVLERSIGIPIPIRSVLWNPLIYYVEGFNGSHALLALGAGMLLNHAPRHLASVRKVMLYTDGQWKFRDPYQRSVDFLHEYSAYVKEGEEFLVDYGEDWFEDRGLSAVSLFQDGVNGQTRAVDVAGDDYDDSNDSLQEERWHLATSCSDFWMSLEPEYNIVVARRDIPTGTAIEVSRALLLPVTDSLTTSGPLEEVLWWMYDSPRSLANITEHPTSPYAMPEFAVWHGEYALLLSGKSALLATSMDSCDAVDRFAFSDSEANVELRYKLQSQAVLKDECSYSMVVEAVAIKDIRAGDILRVSACRDPLSQRKFLSGSSLDNLSTCLSIKNKSLS